MKENNIFQRIEKKYMMNEKQYHAFLEATKAYIAPDAYGLHTINNIYYDTENYELIRHSIGKPKYKEKFRVRSYGDTTEESLVFLEIKKKYDGIVYKRRIAMHLKDARHFLKTGETTNEDQITKEIKYFLDFYHPEAKLFLAYDRTAYVGTLDKELRVTIDQHIRSRRDHLDLSLGDTGDFLLGEDCYLMEIKVPDAYPMWLAKVLSEYEIYPVSFSKYGSVYKNAVQNEEIDFAYQLAEEQWKKEKTEEEMKECLQVYSAG